MSDKKRETLHNFTIEYVKVLAEVFGWNVKTSKGTRKGPDVIIEHTNAIDMQVGPDCVMFVEVETKQAYGCSYFRKVAGRLETITREYLRYADYFSLVIITNSPKNLSDHIRSCKECKDSLTQALLRPPIEGMNVFFVPVLFAKEVLPSIFVRALGAVGRVAPNIPASKVSTY